jgi:membrane-anchored mycosin MYCP
MRRAPAVFAVLLVVATAAAPASAQAVPPPVILPGPPPLGPVAPPTPTEARAVCAVGTAVPGSDFRLRPSADVMLDYTGAWAFSSGAGQRVAVIDTGVSPHPRLPALQGGGDYVASSDGLTDCDARGTFVAGLIAAAPSPDDAFAGVAPGATILSIRQNSGAFSARGGGAAQNDPNANSQGYGSVQTLALAIVHAVDLGATVVNLSDVGCAAVGSGMDDAALGQAVRYAFERNVVVVAAAGDISSQGTCSRQNEVSDPNLPVAQAWNSVRTIASPSWFDDFVLSVAAVTPGEVRSEFSLSGPWVDIAAPGERLTSLSPNGGLANAWPDAQKGPAPVNGSGFAAALVSGVVALVRSRFPQMSAAEVMERIERTAHRPQAGPNTSVGNGVVDPVAALTYDLPPKDLVAVPQSGRPIAPPPKHQVADDRARTVVLGALAACAVIAAAALAVCKKPRRS